MGIRGLTGWIQWAAPSAVDTTIDWTQLRGKRVGVDILGFLYKAKNQRKCVFEMLACLVEAFQRYEIEPVVVFDGKPPDAKKATLQQRSVAFPITTTAAAPNSLMFTSGERELCKQLLYACGVLCLYASGEADDLLAYLSRHGEFDAVFSNDLDLLSRGVEHLYVPPQRSSISCLPGDKSGWTHYTLSNILYESQL
jgi:5'-3' exonuclease